MGRAGAEVRAQDASGSPDWDGAEFASLVEDARAFQRVGDAALPDAAEFLHEVVGGLFGARADILGGRFAVTPWIPDGWKSMALRRLRCHRTLVDIEVRPRAEWSTMRLEAGFGPPIPLLVGVRNTAPVARVTVDEVPLTGGQAIFTLAGEHEVVFFYGEPA